MSITVCRDCGERSPGCHGSCEKYLDAREKHEALMDKWNKKGKADRAARCVQYYGLDYVRKGRHHQ